MSSFWPIGEGAQSDYELLRAGMLAGTPLVSLEARRFARDGLAGLILRPSAPAVYRAVLLGAAQPSWSPYTDYRHEALADGYVLVLDGASASCVGTRVAASSGQAPS